MKPTIEFRIHVKKITLRHIAGKYLTYAVEFKDPVVSPEYMPLMPSGSFIFKETHHKILGDHAKEQIKLFQNYYTSKTGVEFSKEDDTERQFVIYDGQATPES